MEFAELYNDQIENQNMMAKAGLYNSFANFENSIAIAFGKKIPIDDPKLASYHVQQLISEVGEVLEADKRWKTHRNDQYDSNAKLDEIADCFIVLMNIAMFSGFEASEVEEAVSTKIQVVKERIAE